MDTSGDIKKKKFNLVHCRICGEEIDRNADPNGLTWVMKSRNWYYHKNCYETWRESTPATDEEYRAFIFDFIARDLKVSYDYHMCKAQIDKFVRENKMTVKGIFFALKYFYEIKGGDWNKGHGGIGIVPFIYNEACTYWYNREKKTKGVVADIERQMREAEQRQKKIVTKKSIQPRKFEVNLDAIEEMEDDEW